MKGLYHEFGLEEVVTMTGYITPTMNAPFPWAGYMSLSFPTFSRLARVVLITSRLPKLYEYLLSGMVRGSLAGYFQANRGKLIKPARYGVPLSKTTEKTLCVCGCSSGSNCTKCAWRVLMAVASNQGCWAVYLGKKLFWRISTFYFSFA